MMHKPPPQSHSQLGGGKVITGDKLTSSTYDLVEQMQYLYVHVMKARDLPAVAAAKVIGSTAAGSYDPYVEVRVGNYKGITQSEKKTNPEWDCIFAFSRDKIDAAASVLEVTVKDKDHVTTDDFIGWVLFDLTQVPERVVPPDNHTTSPAPECIWYRLQDRKGKKLIKGEVMLAVWQGSQADEAFPEAWHPDDHHHDVISGAEAHANIRSKVYLSPRLWYLKVNVIEAENLFMIHGSSTSDYRTRYPEVFVKATLGDQSLKTRVSTSRLMNNPSWNEDLIFVAAEPFEDHLILSVEDKGGPYENRVLGVCGIHLLGVERRFDNNIGSITTRWYNLHLHDKDDHVSNDQGEKKEVYNSAAKYSSRLCMRICLEGGYHVMDEPSNFCSDLRPTAEQLWKKSIGVLELGILSAQGLLPTSVKTNKYGIRQISADAYCVAKYGRKWVRTRTVIDNLNPKWNEQYTWEVFDPCTVITIGVFDNCCHDLQGGLAAAAGARDIRIGKVRIRLSTLDTDCVYSQSYPLLALHPSGVKKMGEIHLAVRFTCSSQLNKMHMYSQPLLPKMHYLNPLTDRQMEHLMYRATQIVSKRLNGAHPPLRKEVVEYMLDSDYQMWSMRRSKANFFRIMGVLGGPIAAYKWFDDIRNWKNPIATLRIHILFVILVLYPQFILPSIFLSLLLLGVRNYKWRPRYPPKVDTRLSRADDAHPDELDEEFDTFPTSRPADIVRMRYDRLRSVSGRAQTLAGDMATHGERLQSLLSWRDPTATTLFIVFCLIAAIVVYAKPLYVVVIQTGFTVLSHPRFQHNLPSVPLNFFRRLPSKIDCML